MNCAAGAAEAARGCPRVLAFLCCTTLRLFVVGRWTIGLQTLHLWAGQGLGTERRFDLGCLYLPYAVSNNQAIRQASNDGRWATFERTLPSIMQGPGPTSPTS